MPRPLNNTVPDIATVSKELRTNDFCESLLLFAINVQTLLNIINKPKCYIHYCSLTMPYFDFDQNCMVIGGNIR